MKLYFTGMVDGLMEGIQLLRKDLAIEICEKESEKPFQADADGYIEVRVSAGDCIKVAYKDGKGYITYKEKIHFFRALGLFIETLRMNKEHGKFGDFEFSEPICFDKNGIMLDVSRNGVLKTDTVKYFLRKMALMGLNFGMLYTEDTYEVREWPYFGYMRGRYSYEELRDIDDYANIFGIELIPCIQTLSHLGTVLKWNTMAGLKDTNNTLLVGNEKVYKFIEDMIVSASKPYRSKRIHIGMDEADDIGLGRFLDLNGYKPGYELMTEHLKRVMDILNRHNLEPMMWSDMFFRLASKSRAYYDTEGVIPDEVIASVPENIGLVYWDYYHVDEGFYTEFIRRHKKFNNKIIFAGGTWTWNGIAVNYGKAFATTNAALKVCKKEGIREVFCTAWGDNGAETNLLTAFLGMQLYAEHGYAYDIDMEKVKQRFKFCVGMEAEAFIDISLLDAASETDPENTNCSNPSKYLLYQDPLVGLFDCDINGLDLKAHYASLKSKYSAYSKMNSSFELLFKFYEKLASTLEIKAELGVNIIKAYKSGDREELSKTASQTIPELLMRFDELRNAWRKLWLSTNKPFGFEVIDIRLGGVEARLKSAQGRLDDYLSGKCEILEELEEERLPIVRRNEADCPQIGRNNRWSSIVTACPI